MSRAKKQLVALGVLVLVMGAVYAKRWGAAPASEEKPQPASVAPADRAVSKQGSAGRQVQRERAAELAWGRDPFNPPTLTAASPGGLHLSGILWDPVQPLAVINGQTAVVGDTVGRYRVTQILQDRVTLTDGTQTLYLHVGSSE